MTDKDYLAEVQAFLRLESEAIAQTATRLEHDQVNRVVKLLSACKGKIVILGVASPESLRRRLQPR